VDIPRKHLLTFSSSEACRLHVLPPPSLNSRWAMQNTLVLEERQSFIYGKFFTCVSCRLANQIPLVYTCASLHRNITLALFITHSSRSSKPLSTVGNTT